MFGIAPGGLFLPLQEAPARDLFNGREQLLANRGFMRFLDQIPHPAAILTRDDGRLVLANAKMIQSLGTSDDTTWVGSRLNRPENVDVVSEWRLRLRPVEIRGRAYRLLTVVPARALEEMGC